MTKKKIETKNAIILAAGKSSRFAPFTYEKPKGLFRVKGEILIERQIEQLHQAGVREIYIVIGYMKEKFFYLEQKYILASKKICQIIMLQFRPAYLWL